MKMMPLALTLHAPQTVMVSSSPIYLLPTSSLHNRTSFRAFCSSVSPETIHSEGSKAEYKPGNLDHFFLNSFRDKLVKGCYRKLDGIRRSLDMMDLLNWRKPSWWTAEAILTPKMLRCSNLNSFFSLFCSLYILLVVVALDMTGSNIEVTVSAIIVRALQNPYSSYRWREGRCNDGCKGDCVYLSVAYGHLQG